MTSASTNLAPSQTLDPLEEALMAMPSAQRRRALDVALTTYESQEPREDPLTKRSFKVVRRLVDRTGKTRSLATRLTGATWAEAKTFIEGEQANFERHGVNQELDYYWASNAKSPGCAPEFITRWTIER